MPAKEAVLNLMIRQVDQLWQEHLLQMDHLRTDVNVRAAGNRDPLLEFKHDAFQFFDEFSRNVRTEIAQDIFRFEIVVRPPPLAPGGEFPLGINVGSGSKTNLLAPKSTGK